MPRPDLLREQVTSLSSQLAGMRKAMIDLKATAFNLANVAEDESRHDTLDKYACDVRRSITEASAALSAAQAPTDSRFDFVAHLARQAEFSQRTFGPGVRTAGVVDHIRKELLEIEAKPHDLSEWIDVVILGLDGAWRAGYSPEQIVSAIIAKQVKNETRKWPDWRTAAPDKAIEHVRDVAQAPTPEGLDRDLQRPCSLCGGDHMAIQHGDLRRRQPAK